MFFKKWNSIRSAVYRAASRFQIGWRSLRKEKTVLCLAALFIASATALIWHQSRLQAKHMESSALQDAARYSEALAEFRTIYSSEVVQRVHDQGIAVSHDYETNEAAIPLPATLSIKLGNRMAEKGTGGRTRLYSPYPFPWRRDSGGLGDDFARDAWSFFQEHSNEPFFRFETVDDRPSLRYATADLMRKSCVHCHNTHQHSPKTDWKDGDVRGVLEVVFPLDKAIARTQSDFRATVILVSGLVVLGISCVLIVTRRLRRTSMELEQRVTERTADLQKENAERKRAEAEREKLHQQLVQSSHQAGKAEMATGVLHNVGNVLNSVNVSANLAVSRIRSSHIDHLAKAVALVDEHAEELAEFIASDKRGRQLPRFLRETAKQLATDRDAALAELESLTGNIEHINRIVDVQQSCARACGVVAPVALSEVLDDALKVNEAALSRHSVEVRQDYHSVRPVVTDRTKVLQILVNLISNAKYALHDSDRTRKVMTVRVNESRDDRVKVEIADNGIGIPQENLDRIFTHGFTTKKEGHGFGLHTSALAAKALGGSLTVHSGGIGEGATFTLELPAEQQIESFQEEISWTSQTKVVCAES